MGAPTTFAVSITNSANEQQEKLRRSQAQRQDKVDEGTHGPLVNKLSEAIANNQVQSSVGIGAANGDWHIVGTGDFNGDGKSDILWQNSDGTPAVWMMDGTTVISGSNVGFDPGSSWHVIPQHHDVLV